MPPMNVAIVDYGMGNLFSVAKVCEQVGLSANVTNDPLEVLRSDAVILPGIGGFVDAMIALNERGLDQAVITFANTGKPLMGVCLGMQLLCSDSNEFEYSRGLNLVPGKVTRLPTQIDRKVPEVGWNDVSLPKGTDQSHWTDTPLKTLPSGALQYFVHSYYVTPQDRAHILSTTTYGSHSFCSSIRKGNVFGFQFHPERSARLGLAIYKGFADLIKTSAQQTKPRP